MAQIRIIWSLSRGLTTVIIKFLKRICFILFRRRILPLVVTDWVYGFVHLMSFFSIKANCKDHKTPVKKSREKKTRYIKIKIHKKVSFKRNCFDYLAVYILNFGWKVFPSFSGSIPKNCRKFIKSCWNLTWKSTELYSEPFSQSKN